MDGLTGAYLKLQNAQVPLKERIELCRYVLSSNECFLPNKSQVLADWLCQELHHLHILQRREDSEALVTVRKNQMELWKLLHQVLKSPLSEHILVRQRFLPILFGELELLRGSFENDALGGNLDETTHSCCLSVFLCCQDLLQNAQTSLVLFNKLDNMEQCLKEILSCFLAILLQPSLNQANIVEELCKLVAVALQHYVTLQHQQVNQCKIFTSLCEKLLHLLLMVKTAVNDKNNVFARCSLQGAWKTEITSKIDAVVGAGLFHKDHMLNYKSASEDMNDKEPSPKKQKLSSYSNQLFEVLGCSFENTKPKGNMLQKGLATQDIWKKSVCSSLPFILKSFLKASKDEQKLGGTAKFRFFIELYNIIPVTPGHNPDPALPEVDRIAILNQMLQIILDYDVYQIAEDNINDQPLFKWLVNLTQCLMQSSDDCGAILYQSFDTLLKLNHKILEQFLERVVERCLVKTHHSQEIQKEKVKVLCNLVDIYSKLQQIEYLMKCIFKVASSSCKSLGVIPVDVQSKLAEAFECCPLNLTLSLFQLFVEKTKTQVECLKHCLSRDNLSKKDFSGTALELITVLFVTFLCNSSCSAYDQHGIDIKKVKVLCELMEDVRVSLLAPLIGTFPVCSKSCQKEIGFSALYLLYGLNEITNYLNRHDIIVNSSGSGTHIYWNSMLGTFSPHQSWDSMEILAKNGRLMFCTDLLVLQRARYLLTSRSTDQEEINRLVNFLYSFKYSLLIPKSSLHSWNADPCCVTTKNYPAAHWSLVARNAPLLLPYCVDQHVSEFAKFFLKTYNFRKEECSKDDSLITVHQVSSKLLDVDDLHELPSLQAAVVKEFWELVGESAVKVTRGKTLKLLNVFSWNISEGVVSKTQEIVNNVIQGNSASWTQDSGDENEEKQFQKSSNGEAAEGGCSSNMVEPTTKETHLAVSLAQDLADLMNDISIKMSKKRLKRKKCEVSLADAEDLSDIQNLIEILQRLPCSHFTPSNQVRCVMGLLACDVLAQNCTVSVDRNPAIALQLSCRRYLVTFLQGCIQQRNFTAWRVVDMRALFAWLHATFIMQDLSFDGPISELRFQFATASHDLLGHAVKLCLKSRNQTSLSAIRGFSDQLLASSDVSADKDSKSNAKTLDVIFTLISACTKLLQRKSIRKSSASTASEVILGAAVVLVDHIILILKDGQQPDSDCNDNVEISVLRLVGIITRALGLVSGSNIYENSCSDHMQLRGWSQVVALAVTQIMPKLENKTKSLPTSGSNDQVVTYIEILEAICQFHPEYRDVLPDDFQTSLIRICLDILRTCRLFFEPERDDGKLRELREPILQLFSTMLEVNEGENCIAALVNLVEFSADEVSEEPPSKLLTGLSVVKMLMAKKIVKKRKKDMRTSFGRVLITLSSRATANVDVLTLVLEIIAAVVTHGSGSLYSQDLSLVFQALALARKVKVDNLRTFSRIFMARFEILSWTLFYYPDYVYGTIHVYLTCVQDLLSSLLAEGSKASTVKSHSAHSSTILTNCTQKMARLYHELTSHKEVFSKYSNYFLADCIHQLSTQGIPGLIRDALVEGVHNLFDICKEDSLTNVHVYLPSNERELFRSLKEDFVKHHKFKGNA